MKTKLCPKCNNVKAVTDFGKDKSRKDGLRYSCKGCTNAQNRKWREANPEKKRAYGVKYYRDHREKCRDYAKQYLEANPDYSRQYYADNPERSGFGYFLQRCGKSREQILADYGMTSAEIHEETRAIYKEAQRLRDETGDQYHVDHIVPVALGGEHRAYNLQVLNTAEHVEKTKADNAAIKAASEPMRLAA